MGSGLAFIKIQAASNELCWEFEQLKNIPATPDEAGLEGRVRGEGISFTPLSNANNEYVASGCAQEPPLLLGFLIEHHPHDFQLIIRNSKYFGRELRGRL